MVQIGLLFLAFTLLVLLLFTIAAAVYVPQVLSEHAHDEDEDESNGHAA
ncbi:MAG: hypothetical protein V5A45_06570 [Haloarculaceae archaeon]